MKNDFLRNKWYFLKIWNFGVVRGVAAENLDELEIVVIFESLPFPDFQSWAECVYISSQRTTESYSKTLTVLSRCKNWNPKVKRKKKETFRRYV